MAVPNFLNLEFYSGDDDELKFVMKSNGVIIDITGASAIFQVRTSTDAATTILNITATIDGPAGEIVFPISKANTAALTPGNVGPIKYVHDIQLTYASGIVETIFYGPVTGHADVTRTV